MSVFEETDTVTVVDNGNGTYDATFASDSTTFTLAEDSSGRYLTMDNWWLGQGGGYHEGAARVYPFGDDVAVLLNVESIYPSSVNKELIETDSLHALLVKGSQTTTPFPWPGLYYLTDVVLELHDYQNGTSRRHYTEGTDLQITSGGGSAYDVQKLGSAGEPVERFSEASTYPPFLDRTWEGTEEPWYARSHQQIEYAPDGRAYLLQLKATFTSSSLGNLLSIRASAGYVSPIAPVQLSWPWSATYLREVGDDIRLSWNGGTGVAEVDPWVLGPAGWRQVAQDLPGPNGSYTLATAGALPAYYWVGAHVDDASLSYSVWGDGVIRLREPAYPPAPTSLAADAAVWLSPQQPGQFAPGGEGFPVRWAFSVSDEPAGETSLWIRQESTGIWAALAPAAAESYTWDTRDAEIGTYQFALSRSFDAFELLGLPSPWLRLV